MNLVLLLGNCLTIYAYVYLYYFCLMGSTVNQFIINTCLLDELLTYYIYAYVLYYIEFSYIVLINLHSHCIHVYLTFCMICYNYCISIIHLCECVTRITRFMHYTRTCMSYHSILYYTQLHGLQIYVICIMCHIIAHKVFMCPLFMCRKRGRRRYLRSKIIVTNYRICKILLLILCNILQFILLFMFHRGFCLLWPTSNIYTVAIISIALENILYLIAWSQCIGRLIIKLISVIRHATNIYVPIHVCVATWCNIMPIVYECYLYMYNICMHAIIEQEYHDILDMYIHLFICRISAKSALFLRLLYYITYYHV